jgi:hypothetical protein
MSSATYPPMIHFDRVKRTSHANHDAAAALLPEDKRTRTRTCMNFRSFFVDREHRRRTAGVHIWAYLGLRPEKITWTVGASCLHGDNTEEKKQLNGKANVSVGNCKPATFALNHGTLVYMPHHIYMRSSCPMLRFRLP